MPSFSVRPLTSTLGLSVVFLGLLVPLALVPRAKAQTIPGDTTEAKIAQATDFSIPSAPAFALLDVSPANVHTPAYPRDFKVDWIVNDDQLASNIAIQAAPVWIFGFENVSASGYRDLSPIVRQLSSLELSAATTQQGNNRFLAAAAKLNLYNAADPLADASYTTALSDALSFSDKQTQTQNQLFDLIKYVKEDSTAIDTADTENGIRDSVSTYTQAQQNAVEKLAGQAGKFGPFNPLDVKEYKELSPGARQEIRDVVDRMKELHEDLQNVKTKIAGKLREVKQKYEVEHWNAFRLDVAGGPVYRPESPQLDSLSLTSPTEGWGGWMTGAWGFGTDRLLATGMARAITADTGHDDNQARYFVGVNLRYRYGSSLDNAFVEYIRRFGDRPNRHEIAYGGSLDLTERLNVQFGLRTAYDDDLDLRDLRPTIKLNGKATDLLGAL